MAKISIAFINVCSIDIDFSTIEECNPGIGGTEYLFLNIPYQLNKYNQHDITIYSNHNVNLVNARTIKLKRVNNIDEAYIDAINNNIDIFITREDMIPSKKYEGKTKLILWLHLSHSYKETKQFASFFDSIIFVSKHEMERYCFDKLIRKKGMYIYNIPPSFTNNYINNTVNNYIVCFIGSLNPGKNFASLTEAWPNIVKKYPTARLYVIGSGNLYNPNLTLGPYNIAEASYESEILKPLLKTSTMDSVTFFGKKNTFEISNILKDVNVGISNMVSETFCMTVFDFAKLKIPVICKRKGGIKELTNNSNSYPFKTKLSLYRSINRAFKNNQLRVKKGNKLYNDLLTRFSKKEILNNWNDFINNHLNILTLKKGIFTIMLSFVNYCLNIVKRTFLKVLYFLIKVKNFIIHSFK